MKKAIPLALALTIFGIGTFWRVQLPPGPETKISKDAATILAAALANQEAARRYGVSPFSASKGEVSIENGQWTWTALKGYGTSDLQATVVVAQGKPTIEISQNIISPWE